MGRFGILLCILYFINIPLVQPQNPAKYKFQKISLEQGLSHSVVTACAQDKLGFMWFATQDGLNRFDGYHFINFYNQKDNPYSLSNNFIQSVLCDNDNEIWVATLDGLCRFDYFSEHFTVFYNEPSNVYSISGNEINCLALAANGNIWIGTSNQGLNYFNKKTKQFFRFQHLISNNITAIFEDKDSVLWIGTFDSGIECIDLKTNHHSNYKALSGNFSYLQTNYIRCITQDSLGNVWIGTNKGLARFLKKSKTFQVFIPDSQKPGTINGNIVRALMCDSKKHLWVGTEENGLNILDISKIDNVPKVNFQQIRMSENEFGLSIRTVNTIFLDRDKNIWIGTYSGGINFISNLTEKFQKYQYNPYDNNSINYPKIWGICEDKSGNIWIGTDGAGIDKLNPVTNTIIHFTHNKNNPNSISDNAILCAFRDHNNTLWFGTYAGGLNKYDNNEGIFINYRPVNTDKKTMPVSDIRVIYEDNNQTLWVGTNGGGLCKYNPQMDNFSILNVNNSNISSNDVRALLDDGKGNLYIGTYSKGLDIYNMKAGSFKNYKHDKINNKSLSDNYVYALVLDKKKRIWIGTGNGLSLFDESSGCFVNYDEKNGLANNYIHAIIPDRIGNLWISTNKGISKFITKENKFQNYDYLDGLQKGEFNDGSALIDHNGKMWFGGINGLNSFFPNDISKSKFEPNVVLSDFLLFNSSLKAKTPQNPDSPLPSSISTSKKIILNYKQSVFTIDFVALNYGFPEKTQYAYRMKNYDMDWNDAGPRRTATYRDLPAGKYLFEVKASNQDGLWSKKTSQIEIVITPPFWKTWWAYLIYMTMLFSVLYIIYNYYKQQIALKNKLLLEQVSHQKDLELNKERFRFFTNISHEFRTPLTLILGPVEELMDKEGQRSFLGQKLILIYRNAHKLLDLINMLLDFRKVESGNMELKIMKGDIVQFSRDILNTFQSLAQHKGIALKFIASSEHIEAWFDREKLEIIFNNLLSNALKFTPKGGDIKVEIQERTPQLFNISTEIIAITITDTGIGIAEKHINHIFDSYYSLEHSEGIKGTGIGLALTKSLVEMHKGKIIVESIEKQGSSFIIEIQKGNKHFPHSQISESPDESNEMQIPLRPNFAMPNLISDANEVALDPDQLVDKKIMLVVEDNDDVRSYIVESFTGKYTVLQAIDGMKGYSIASKHVPDIIISDIMMPEMDGIEFCHKIKKNLATSHVPVILLTARSSITHKKEGYEIGADLYVTKPFSIDLLGTMIENLLETRKQLRDYYTRTMLFQTEVAHKENPEDKFMKILISLVEKNINDPGFDVIKLANELNISRSVLYRKVKALTDMSIIEFVRTVRLNKAAQMLKAGNYRVSDVAFEVGFNDLKYFRQCFKEQFNISPSDILRNRDAKQLPDN
jgi:ligand-binding sensor domain-containing protein/signal transduction histidine kinase/DNA-binding response OmpR family regulator